jgi:membrane-associated phospholipid phosphatase
VTSEHGSTPRPVVDGASVMAPSRNQHRDELLLAAIGVGMVVVAALIARNGDVGQAERAVFRAINRLPGWLFPVLWPIAQLGNLLAGPVVAAVAAVLRRWRLCVAALVVTFVDLEEPLKNLVERERPGTTVGDVTRHGGDVPLSGLSFPSGHAMLAAALATIVTPYLRGRWRIVPWVLVVGVCLARVYVGAHNPLDVVAGCGLGLLIGAAICGLMSTPGAEAAG